MMAALHDALHHGRMSHGRPNAFMTADTPTDTDGHMDLCLQIVANILLNLSQKRPERGHMYGCMDWKACCCSGLSGKSFWRHPSFVLAVLYHHRCRRHHHHHLIIIIIIIIIIIVLLVMPRGWPRSVGWCWCCCLDPPLKPIGPGGL